jgi:hypothetical protein
MDQPRDTFSILSLLRSVIYALPHDSALIAEVNHLATTYNEFIRLVLKSEVKQNAELKKARANFLTTQASVVRALFSVKNLSLHVFCYIFKATFLAAVQIGFIAFTAGVNAYPSSTIQRVIDIFSFCAVSFDALGALSALTTAQTLLKVYSQADQFMQDKSYVEERMYESLFHLQTPRAPEGGRGIEQTMRVGEASRTTETDIETIRTLAGAVHAAVARLGVLDHDLKNHAIENNAALLIIIFGVICFFVSLIAFIINSQPKVVWVPTVVVVAGTTTIVLINENKGQTGRWTALISRCRTLFGFWAVGDAVAGHLREPV